MSGCKGYGGRHKGHRGAGGGGGGGGHGRREKAQSVAGDSAVLTYFRELSRRLNARHDRHERLVKLSRDITIESKRIIFLLHSPVNGVEGLSNALSEAGARLTTLARGGAGAWPAVARELRTCPAHMHARALTYGLQEFVEAFAFHHLLATGELPSHQKLQDMLTYTTQELNISRSDGDGGGGGRGRMAREEKDKQIQKEKEAEKEKEKEAEKENDNEIQKEKEAETDVDKKIQTDKEAEEEKEVKKEMEVEKEKVVDTDKEAGKGVAMESVVVERLEFVLGLADVTGELMRRAISGLCAADGAPSLAATAALRDMYAAFLGVQGGGRELASKMETMRSSVLKAEGGVYALRVRALEGAAPAAAASLPPPLPMPAPPPRLLAPPDDLDEGFY